MNAFLLKYKFHFFIILIALSVLLILDFILQLSTQNIRFWDSLSYAESAFGMYKLHCGNAYRPMIITFITGLPYLFGGNENDLFVFSFWLNLFCWVGFFIIQFEILKDFLNPKIAFLSVIISILFISNAVSVFHLLTENIFMFVVILGFYFILKYNQYQKFLYLSIALSIFILSVLIKPGMKFFAIICLLCYCRTIFDNYKSKISYFIYASLFLIFIQCAGIKYQFGTFTISFVDSVTYYNYLGYKARCFKENKVYDQKPERLSYLYVIDLDLHKKIVKEDLIDQLKNNKINLLKAYIDDFRDNITSGSANIVACKNIKNDKNFDFYKKILFKLTIYENIIFTILGIILSFLLIFKTFKKNDLMFLISLFMIYTISTSAISCSEGDRFHSILFPFVIITIGFATKNMKFNHRIYD